MKVLTEYFHTESEALAFVRGVELVNDSDVSICGPRLQEGFEEGEENAWAVAVHDAGPIMVDDTCPLCGACDSEVERVEDRGEDLHECDNCGKTWHEDNLKYIQDLWERVEPGGTVPSGECPNCGALCYPTKGGA